MKKRILAAILATLGIAGCSTEHFSWITHTWTTEHGVQALDHVSWKRVDVQSAVQRHYLGETYYFESEEHAKAFDANPYAYLYSDNIWLASRPDRVDWN